MKKKSWICLLNSTANSVQFGWKLAGLAVLFSRQTLKVSQDFFFSLIFQSLIIFLNMKPLRTFLDLGIILSIVRVCY